MDPTIFYAHEITDTPRHLQGLVDADDNIFCVLTFLLNKYAYRDSAKTRT